MCTDGAVSEKEKQTQNPDNGGVVAGSQRIYIGSNNKGLSNSIYYLSQILYSLFFASMHVHSSVCLFILVFVSVWPNNPI